MPRDVFDLPQGLPCPGLDRAARRVLSGWLALAGGALAVAVALTLVLVAARTPGIQGWSPGPWQSFFHRAPVTHGVFAFVAWPLAMLGALASAARPAARPSGVGLALAAAGAVLLLVPALAEQGQPSLNDYVPVLVHPLFYAGLALLAAGVAVPVLNLLARPPVWGENLALGAGAAGALFLLALVATAFAWLHRPAGTHLADFNESLFWGGGHLLQFANAALLLTGWQVLGERAFARAPLPPRAWRILAVALVLAGIPGPALYGYYDVGSEGLRHAFTLLYQIALSVPLLAGTVFVARAVLRGPRNWFSVEFLAVAASLALAVAGGLSSLFVDGADLRTPAHVVADAGAVTLVSMGLVYAMLLPGVQRPLALRRGVRLQFWLYGIGQGLFAAGLFAAGWDGVARTATGVDLGLDSVGKAGGMGLAGLGALVAVCGGALFVWTVLRRLALSDRH